MEGTVNQRIEYYRKIRGYTQEEIAGRLGMNPVVYSRKERGGKITCDVLLEIADILEVDAYYLLLGKEYKEPQIIQVNTVPPKEPEREPELKHWQTSFLSALNTISSKKRNAIFRLTLLVLNNRQLNIEGIVEKAEQMPNIKKPN